jgi:hypothetical protein
MPMAPMTRPPEHQQSRADPGEQRGDAGAGNDADGEGQERHAGPQGRVAQGLLQVERQEQEEPEQADADQQRGQERAAAVAVQDDAHGQ